ncbi:GTPase Era [Thermosynechococcaceae cyanobacterium BACA0444]|uniref:GTPase Era n=1 Tax=Pseudocalidococcus azoricus BACA0444 TaxID=2918990 RepID=A0AAE4FR68_9CYAN|nr:GTPase Era [Pseudocalidococcus azoricus]MDS3859431.1 GTPase Era [Pseudocalidococcus azoricus BACA0444]
MLIPQAPPDYRSGFIAIIGRPNVGKSTLMNQLIGQKVAITSPVAQTTRNRLRGILTTAAAQLIFVDTPGIHKPHHSLGQVLVSNAKLAINAVDVILFVVDGSVKAGNGDRYIAELLKTATIPVILGQNKTDRLTDPGPVAATYQELAQTYGWQSSAFSALTETGLPELQQQLVTLLPPGPYYYPPDLVTDQPERFIMGELIREQILAQTRDEVPHSVAVTIEQVVEEPKITKVLASIYVERPSQKAIIIGKGGLMLKAIGTEARAQMQKLILGPVYLELFVKVRTRWRQSKIHLAELGYRVESD